MLLVLAVVFELGARVAYCVKDMRAVSDASLDEYEMRDPDCASNYILRPGFRQTLAEAIEAKDRAGRALGVKIYKDTATMIGMSDEDTALSVNQSGFRGAELDHSHTSPRIVCVGDSCTFGLLNGTTYPERIAQVLQRDGLDVEVVNAGVEGYSAKRVLRRIDDIKALRPEIVTIYIGWNSLFVYQRDGFFWRHLLGVRLTEAALGRLEHITCGSKDLAQIAFDKPKHPDLNDPLLERLVRHDYIRSCRVELRQVVEALESIDTRIALITLPGLYTMEPPSEKAMEMGHLPEFTENPHVLAAMTEEYNQFIRELAAEKDLMLIDLDRWSREALIPRDEFFFDSVHLTAEGQMRLGEYISGQLEPVVREMSK